MKSKLGFTIVFLVLAVACSDSVLFTGGPQVPAVPPPPPGAQSQYPGAQTQQPTQIQTPLTGMNFVYDPASSLGNDEAFQTLFTSQSADPFQVQNGPSQNGTPTNDGGKIDMKMSMISMQTNTDRGENHVDMRVSLSVKVGNTNPLLRDFASDGNVVLRNVGQADVMDGRLKPVDTRSNDVFIIRGQRAASTTAEAARKNAWSGEILVQRNAQLLRLGRFQGFSE